MSLMVLQWRQPAATPVTMWRGPLDQSLPASSREQLGSIAAVIGPRGATGPEGGSGQPVRFDVSYSSSWLISHGLMRVPTVQVFLTTGEHVLVDFVADDTYITIQFPTPQQGFVLAY